MYPHRSAIPPGPPNGQTGRINELMEELRQRVDSQSRDCEQYEHQSKEDAALWS